MDETMARSIIESLRIGIPPRGHINQFTVGRRSEIAQLKEKLDSGTPGTMLIKANYGSGKSHLLQYLRENALQSGYVISCITLDSKSAIRFNRMDQIIGAIWRNIEIPSNEGTHGVRPFLDFICDSMEHSKSQNQKFWNDLTNKGHWDFSEALESPSMFIALRAWNTKNPQAQDLIEDWFYNPKLYAAQRKLLYYHLVLGLRDQFRDPRTEYQFYRADTGIFNFQNQEYAQSWEMLQDIDLLVRMSGLKGFVILFDEFEDVLTNLSNKNYQQAAFWNLFQFFSGKQFSGGSFFAVTPEFVQKCKSLLMKKGVYDYDFSRFDSLPAFSMSPLEVQELEELALKIMRVHGTAYAWNPNSHISNAELKAFIKKSANTPVQDRTRKTITDTVAFLDDRLDHISESL
jgi:hypothetical protein